MPTHMVTMAYLRLLRRSAWIAVAERMAPVVREVLDDPTEISAAQEPFREWVAGEKERYDASLDAWIERIVARG